VNALAFFGEEEALLLGAAADRIFPAGEGAPAASELGVVEFLDGQLAGPWGEGEMLYRQGPFEASADGGHGWQSPLTPAEAYRHGLHALDRLARSRHGLGFVALGANAQDELLRECEADSVEADFGENLSAAEFFALLRTNVLEGLFSDPRHGGNRDGAGWAWLGFPARHAAYAVPDRERP
jgi:gluconate 2-dehydrogenase gamma chain